MNRSKAKGTAAESAIVDYLRSYSLIFADVERRTLAGVHDKGDIAGIRGVVIEVKNCATMTLAAWVDEARVETANAAAQIGAVWHKRKGKGSPGEWYVTLSGANFAELLCNAKEGGL